MRISLCTVPVEPDYRPLTPEVGSDEVFASPRAVSELPVMPKIAIVSLIKWMEKNGYPRESWDYYDIDMELPSDLRLERYFSEYQPTVVGLSAVVSTCYSQARKISKIIRSVCPNAWIVLGGSLTASANVVLRKTDVDICVVGDGEITWVDFLNYVKSYGCDRNYDELLKIKGLAYLDQAGELRSTGYGPAIPGSQQPMPDYDILQAGLKDRPEDISNYFRDALKSFPFRTDRRSHEANRRPNVAGLWSTKGCVARCTFCQRSTKGYRVADAGVFDEHIAMLKEKFNVGFIQIIDENFGSDLNYTYELARVLKKHEMLWLAGGVRVRSFKREDIQFLYDHGCTSLQFGTESGSQKMLNLMEKNFTVETTTKALSHLAELDMSSHLAVMVGMPGETNETVEETGQFLGRIMHMQGLDPDIEKPTVFYALPLTGTPLYVYGQQQGFIGRTPEEEEQYLLTVSGTGASKVNYINMNGAPMKDVVSWDWMLKMQAARTFFELDDKEPIDRNRFHYKVMVEKKDDEAIGRALTIYEVVSKLKKGFRTGIKSRLFYSLDYFLTSHIIHSRRLHRLPRWLFFGTVKNLVYFSFLIQKMIAKMAGLDFPLYKSWPKVPTLKVDPKPVKAEYQTSLRTIVKQHDAADLRMKSLTEESQDVLAIGL